MGHYYSSGWAKEIAGGKAAARAPKCAGSGAPLLRGEFRDGDARLDGDGGHQRLPAAGIPPGGAHLGLHGLGIERPPHRLRDGGAEPRAINVGQTAAEQFIPQGFLAGLEGGDLRLEDAELVDELAGGRL